MPKEKKEARKQQFFKISNEERQELEREQEQNLEKKTVAEEVIDKIDQKYMK